MLFSFVSGRLAALHWRFACLSPDPARLAPVGVFAKGRGGKSRERYRALWNGSIGFYLAQSIVASIAFNTNIAMLIESAAPGGTHISGNVTAIYSAIGIVGGLVAGRLIEWFKKYALTLLFLCAALGMFYIFSAGSLLPVIIGTVVVGFSFSVCTGFLLSALLLAAVFAVSWIREGRTPSPVRTGARPLSG